MDRLVCGDRAAPVLANLREDARLVGHLLIHLAGRLPSLFQHPCSILEGADSSQRHRFLEEVELGQDDGWWCVLDRTINRGVLRRCDRRLRGGDVGQSDGGQKQKDHVDS